MNNPTQTNEALMSLAARVEEATEPDPGLEGDIHSLLFGSKTGAELGLSPNVATERYFTDPDTGYGRLSPIPFMHSVEAAERALPGPEWPEWQITRRYCTGYHANIGTGDDGVGCETPAFALLSAALKARAHSERTGCD